MSRANKPKFKIYSKLGLKLTDHPKISSGKLGAKKWQTLAASRKPRRETEYGTLLQAKQRLRAFYGQLKDKQLTRLYIQAEQFEGNQMINFVKLLERRFDIVLFRLKISPSLRECQQLIQHGHFSINNTKVTVPSFILKEDDFIAVNNDSIPFLKEKVKRYLSGIVHHKKISKKQDFLEIIKDNPILFIPNYLEFNYEIMAGKYIFLPDASNICYPMNPKLAYLMEYYKYKRKL